MSPVLKDPSQAAAPHCPRHLSEVPASPPHGGNVYAAARELGLKPADLVDFSANINPLGFPPGLSEALLGALPAIVHYPDPECVELRGELARYHGLSPDMILPGNGSTELIYLLVRVLRPGRTVIVAPAFSEYQKALEAAGLPYGFHLTEEAAGFTLAGPPRVWDAGLVFLANPASPSGALLAPEALLPWLQAWDGAGLWVVLDETFVDFAEEASCKIFLARFPRLLILRSFTKFFALPGLRLGYLLAAPEVIARLTARKEPWSVNTLAQVAGCLCLAEREYMARTRAVVAEERRFLFQGLKSLPGLDPFPGSANYLLVKLTRPGWTAARLRGLLLRQGLIIRDAGNFVGLDDRYFRVAVRCREENQRLLRALASCLDET